MVLNATGSLRLVSRPDTVLTTSSQHLVVVLGRRYRRFVAADISGFRLPLHGSLPLIYSYGLNTDRLCRGHGASGWFRSCCLLWLHPVL